MQEISGGQLESDDLEHFIRRLSRKGVSLWAEEHALRYRAPKGTLTTEERQVLGHANRAIAYLLERGSRHSDFEASPAQSGVRRAPLSFTQLGHWQERLEHGGRPIRHIASAIRLSGPLNVEILSESLKVVGRRHDALRTRVVVRDGNIPLQEVADEYLSDLETIQLFSTPESERPAEIEHQIHRAILDAEDYAVSPLFKAVLLLIGQRDHVLILALDHIISDLASLDILTGEILSTYAQLLVRTRIVLPSVAIQFPDYAAKQRAESEGGRAGPERRFDSAARTCFPEDPEMGAIGAREGWGATGFIIGRGLRDQTCEWARRHGTTIVMTTLTAFGAAVMRLCTVRETIIPFVINGRVRVELENTIGFFAFPVYIRTALTDQTTFAELLKLTTEDYCRGCDQADCGYALAQIPRPEFTRNPAFNWLPGGARGETSLKESPSALTWSPMEFTSPLGRLLHVDAEPSVTFVEREGAILGQLHYPLRRFSERAMQRFTDGITAFLTTLIRTPGRRVMDVNLT